MKALSGDAETDADVAFQVLQQFCVGRRFLIVLDDVKKFLPSYLMVHLKYVAYIGVGFDD
jgi:hypothetical protein